MLNYYCTWNAQNCARPDAVLEPSAEVFLGADGAKKARDYLDEDSIFGSGDLAGQFAPVRDQLYFLLDDGWDVPRGTHPVNDAAIESFGSLELARDRFPSFPGTPAQRLRGVNEALKARLARRRSLGQRAGVRRRIRQRLLEPREERRILAYPPALEPRGRDRLLEDRLGLPAV